MNHDRASRCVRVAVVVAVLSVATAAAWADGSVAAWGYNGYGQCNVPAPNDEFAAVAAGYFHNVALKLDGSIVAWGDNECGQCDVPALNSGFTAIAAGGFHSLGLKADGSVVAWGSNAYHQCDVPAPNADFIAVAAGYGHSLGLKSDGRIIAWGDNALGQCNVPAVTTFVGLAAGFYHSLGLSANGSIAAWGNNGFGQCTVPSPNSGFVALAAGEGHSLGLKIDGSIKAWGDNSRGQCTVPSPNSGFLAVAAGQAHSLALRTDCTTVAWGWNTNGQSNVPGPNAGGVAITAGGYHSLSLWRSSVPLPAAPTGPTPEDGATGVLLDRNLDWGDASGASSYDVYFGTTDPPPLLGTVQASLCTLPPLACSTTYYWRIVARNCLGTTSGPTWSFATGNRAPDSLHSPVPADGSANITTGVALAWTAAGAASYDVYLGVTNPPPLVGSTVLPTWTPTLEGGLRWYWQVIAKNDCGTAASPVWSFTTPIVPSAIRAWGYNNDGECNVPAPNTDYVALAGGDDHSLGLQRNGSIVAWGRNWYGQCNVPAPNAGFVAVAGGYRYSLGLKADGSIVAWGSGPGNPPAPNSGFVAIATGYFHALGVKSDGSVVAWGDTAYGQCNVPAPNSGFVAVAGGYRYSLGLKTDGSIVAWGDNLFGQCNIPAPNSGFVAVAAGEISGLGLKANGSIVAWGSNLSGQCDVPAPNSDFVAVAAGGDHSLGLKADGSVVAWGYNAYSECNVPWPNGGFVGVAGGGRHSLGLKSGGALPRVDLPSPADGAKGVSVIAASLSWSNGGLATDYDVYFGTANPPPLLGSTLLNRWTPPPFACETTYYWQVVGRNCNGTTIGPMWTFSTTDHPPDTPSGTSPSDGAANVAPDAVLGWTPCEGASSYDVYFGETNPPPFLGTTEASSWTPPPLVCWTTYHWQVVARNCAGTTPGPVWSFSTATALPDPPAGPTPSNGATNVAIDAVLEWMPAGQATSYDIYFGTTNPPPLKASASATSWTPPGLTRSGIYYWQVVPRNGCGTTPGPIWSFITIPRSCPGEMNCDSWVSFADINAFVLALQGQSAYEAAYPACRWLNADVNGDGVVSYADINPFVNAIQSGGRCP